MTHSVLTRATDLKPQYMWMGNWRNRLLQKGTRASRTSSKPARLYVAVPPAEGWPGGSPEKNGYRGRGTK